MIDWDDPYSILACQMIIQYGIIDLQRILTDSDFLRRVAKKEARDLDIKGQILDVVYQDMVDKGKRKELMAKLSELGLFFYDNLDKQRLRKNIRDYYLDFFEKDLLDL